MFFAFHVTPTTNTSTLSLHDALPIFDFDPPKSMGGKSSLPEERSLTYCALYDNGFSDPTDVKLKSTSPPPPLRSEEHTSELQSLRHLVCRLLLEKKYTLN